MKWFSLGLIIFHSIAISQPEHRDVLVHLFEWRWNDIALECKNFLGPQGFGAVQVAPPQEHGIWPGRPWWERYQPVSYQLESKSGTAQEFRAMVRTCSEAGVAVIVDAVLNHMGPMPPGMKQNTGSAGSVYYPYLYPGLFGPEDFHYCRGPDKDNNIKNFDNRWEVQNCELVHLSDLKTESPSVRARIAGYLNGLLGIGVSGFRIDAAKHIPSADLAAIFSGMHRTNSGQAPYLFSEVYDYGSGDVRAAEYFPFGDVTEFRYPLQLAHVFLRGNLAWLQNFGEAWGFSPSEKSLVFVDNHDTQRALASSGDALTYKTPQLYRLANQFLLAWPYGRPSLMSSFAFNHPDQAAPSLRPGVTRPVYLNGVPQCSSQGWICEHRSLAIASMVRFRNVTASHPTITNWWSNQKNQIAFGRGNLGFAIFNRESTPLTRRFQTAMPAGRYCEAAAFSAESGRCAGQVMEIEANGTGIATVPPMAGLAIHAGTRLMR